MIVLWGSNARAAHPIFFHHLLTGVHNGARLFVVDPRRTASAQWADTWLGLDVGTDIALANTVAAEIIRAGLQNDDFISRATSGFDEFATSVEPWTLEAGEMATGVPAAAIRELAHAYASAGTAQLCWTLGITEHHNATDNVLALINLALLCGHVGRFGSGLTPLRGQNNVQGGGDMGALPNKLPGFQDVTDPVARARAEQEYGGSIPAEPGWNLTQMFAAMERRELTACYVIGENPAQSEADVEHARALLSGLDHLVVQDIFLTATAELADVVLPASAAWCESDGTVTNSERRVQRVRKALDPPGDARDDIDIITELARRLGHPWPTQSAEQLWDELRRVSPMHRGMSYARLEALGGIQWPCYDEDTLEPPYLHGRLWADDPADRGPAAAFHSVEHELPVDEVTDEYPLRLTTGRHLDGYNTGVQSNRFPSPIRRGGALEISPEDAAALRVAEGDEVRIVSRRGAITAPVSIDVGLRPGLVFMAIHSPDESDANLLTIDAVCPQAGTAEFKAAAVRVEPSSVGAH
ncbi:MAG: molybdopterin-dependent oxidoreductase [Acidimicrobiales bacterium]|nr:molybdopterin-dependent oxidoreductase [Acidimicrobiales bacterium]